MLSWNFFSCAALHTLQFVSKNLKKQNAKFHIFYLRNILVSILQKHLLYQIKTHYEEELDLIVLIDPIGNWNMI